MEKTAAFGVSFFYRVIVPGGLAALLSLPLLTRVLPQIGVGQGDITMGVVIVGLLVGLVLEGADDAIYKLYEGIRGWPPPWRRWVTGRWQARVDRLQWEAKTADAVRRGAIWAELGRYPLTDEGKPFAALPTRLGNILASYERYPHHRYGMNAMIFWPRLWATLSKDVREAVERDWSSADALIHGSAALVLVGLAYIVAGATSALAAARGANVLFESDDLRLVAVAAGVALMLLSFIPYRLSLGPLQLNGMVFRSLFDMYRDNLAPLKVSTPGEWTKWDDLGNELLYGASPRPEADPIGDG